MTITWRDAVTTAVAAAVVVLERAYFHSWSWLSVSSTRWTILAFALLGAVVFYFNAVSGRVITWVEYALGAIGVLFAVLGLWTGDSGYLPLLMLDIIAVWLVSLGNHVAAWLTQPQHGHVH